MLAFIKAAMPKSTTNVVLLFRFSISLSYILIYFLFQKLTKKEIKLKTTKGIWHFFRGVIAILGMSFLYISLKYVPLVEANLLSMTNPLFVPFIAYILFRQKISIKHLLAVSLGFIGVILILKPGFENFNVKALYALVSGVCIAGTVVLLRFIAKHDNVYICMFYYFLLAFVFSVLTAPFNWVTPDFFTVIMLIGAGLLGTVYQHFLILASANAPAKIVSALLYTSLIFSVFFSFFFENEAIGFLSWTGICLVCLSNVVTVFFASRD